MKPGWKSKKLIDIVDDLHQGLNTAGHKIKFVEDGYPIIQTRNLVNGEIDLTNKIKYMSQEDWLIYKSKYKPKIGDVFLTNIGTIGKTAVVTEELDYLIHWNIFIFKINQKTTNPFFLKYFLDTPQTLKHFISSQKGGTVSFITKKMISSVIVNTPPLEEQKQIVIKLDQCFEAIDKARANAAKNLENAKELFQSKLNEIFSQKGEGWVEKKLGEISDVTYGFTDKSVEVGDFRYVRITDIDNNGELISTGKKYIGSSKDGKKFILKDNDILMARTGATFAKLLLYKDIEPSIFASYLIKIDFTESIDNEFYWFYAKSNSYWDQANTLSTGSAQPHFNGKALKQVLFPYPVSKTEQSRLINEFKRFQSKTQSLESKYQQELNSLEELKKSILQKAFEGEL